MKNDAKEIAITKIMVADSYLRGHVGKDEVAEIWQELDDEPDAPGWGDVMAGSLLTLILLGLVIVLGLIGWPMAIR
jgi:hypothetical protein